MKTVTVRLTDTAYEKLRRAAFLARCSQNEILATGVALWIEQNLPDGLQWPKGQELE